MNGQSPRVILENQQPQQSPMKMLEASLEEEIYKVKKIGEIIEKLEAQQKKVKEKTNNRETSFYRILGKYITFLEYIRSIIEVKIGKDQKIIALQENVFNSINVITNRIQNNINLSLPQEEANISKTPETPKQNNDYPNTTIEQLDIEIQELTYQFEELTKKQNKEKVYLLDFNTSITGLNLDNKEIIKQKEIEIKKIQEACTKSIKNNVNTFITTLSSAQTGGTNNNAKLNTPSFQGNSQGYYDIIINNIFKTSNTEYGLTNNNITENQKIHTDKLKEIKEAYEEQLKINVKNYKKICDALKTLLEKIGETNDKLKIFNKSKERINEKNKLMEEINTANKGIDETNKDIQNANKIIKDKREKKAQVEKLQEQKTQLETLIKNNKIIYKILDLQDIKNDKIFQANHEALVGNNDESGLYGEIKNAQSKLINIKIPQNTPQGTGQGTSNPGIDQQSQGPYTSTTASVTTIESNNSGTSSMISNDSVEIGENITDILNTVQEDDINNVSQETLNQLDDISEKIIALQEQDDYNYLINNLIDPPPTPRQQQPIMDLQQNDIDRYNRIVNKINEVNSRIEQISIFIYVMKKYVNDDKIKKALNKAVRDKGLFTRIDKIQLQTINSANGGKYKMKKSKKSKSKTTPKKAKPTKKLKTTRTQTKSYNNPKYKNQDGGFVRGGVLFPESFYRSDIVM